ncbi:MAG: iron ABC transporter permease [Hyphomonas sp.]|nr:iron ABC transporter permease [Hyphomonas sp.]MBU3919565.1 iron ABC transporter permease [Alphaproteobacteria bacterium]MBU4061275.1 iron ABC transporter permease [Alphaproteobacteria bacterium]MBU4162528.1 iron ABC transporter permease [Alphaproteobacteria bacterium]MBU4568563.1 iron ABC transporter permease [Alphaproteobacteria bacterium]
MPVLIAGLVIALPVAIVLVTGLAEGGGAAWEHIRDILLLRYLMGTLSVLTLTAILCLLMAVPAAWIVTMFRFPGRSVFEWLLVLPLAAPGYVLAYAWGDLAGVAGPLQSALRDATGWSAREYWFPDISSLPGLAFVLACSLYPYVYLTARAAFISQSVCTMEAARSLGASPSRTFWSVALPAARPAIAAGLALALMEAAADYGAAEFLGVPTLTYGIVRAWKSFGEPAAAARLALVLLALILTFVIVERRARGRAGTQQSSIRWRQIARVTLTRPAAIGATALCAALFLITFALPIGRLVWRSLESSAQGTHIWDALGNSLILATAGASLSFILALTIALSIRAKGPLATFARIAASSGYAIPGAVLALGALAVISKLPVTLSGLVALSALAWVYAARFTAAGTEPLAAVLARAPVSIGHAAQSLGATPLQRTLRVDLPIAMSGAAAAALVLFVEALKELPATLMLRPFNWDTLSVRAYAYASDERLAFAALPALLITVAGLLPVLLLSWQMSRARPGSDA